MAEDRFPRAAVVAMIVAVAVTYIYFLLFAQFGFLHLLQAAGDGTGPVRAAMATMGLAGLLASLATGAALRRISAFTLMRLGFVASAVSALLAIAVRGPHALLAVAGAVGASVAVTTVALATSLREPLPRRHYGLAVGAGTGVAYLACNVPALFSATTTAQAALASAAAVAGLVAVTIADRGRGARSMTPMPRPAQPGSRPAGDAGAWGFSSLLLAFLALVWLDAAAFEVIQETVGLKGQTWGAGAKLWQLGGTHLVAALLAGYAIDRGCFRSLLLGALGLFAAAFSMLGEAGAARHATDLAGPLYAAGISLYSTALVAYPGSLAERPDRVARRWRAAMLFGVAGWLGSALGIGMAQQLHHIPRVFLLASGATLLGGWGLAHRRLVGSLARAHAATLIAAGLAAAGFLLAGRRAPASGTDALPDAARGRAVYIAEGCIHCHSQYVRQGAYDRAAWGPARPIDRQQEPPLIGTRRQGPDLANVGLRRSALWHRQHLIQPRTVVPSSRMPPYAHLFAEGERRGEDLIAYLMSLGAGDEVARYQAIRAQRFDPDPATGDAGAGRRLFLHWCLPCHGVEGRGDGPLAALFARPAANLRKGPLWSVSWGAGAEPLAIGVARVVKFGLAGTSMPGHETLRDAEVADLVAYVLSLVDAGSSANESATAAGR